MSLQKKNTKYKIMIIKKKKIKLITKAKISKKKKKKIIKIKKVNPNGHILKKNKKSKMKKMQTIYQILHKIQIMKNTFK